MRNAKNEVRSGKKFYFQAPACSKATTSRWKFRRLGADPFSMRWFIVFFLYWKRVTKQFLINFIAVEHLVKHSLSLRNNQLTDHIEANWFLRWLKRRRASLIATSPISTEYKQDARRRITSSAISSISSFREWVFVQNCHIMIFKCCEKDHLLSKLMIFRRIGSKRLYSSIFWAKKHRSIPKN